MLFRVSFCSFPSMTPTTTTIIHSNDEWFNSERRCRDFFFFFSLTIPISRSIFSPSVFFSPFLFLSLVSFFFLRVLHANSLHHLTRRSTSFNDYVTSILVACRDWNDERRTSEKDFPTIEKSRTRYQSMRR